MKSIKYNLHYYSSFQNFPLTITPILTIPNLQFHDKSNLLNSVQKNILGLGLKFIPTPHPITNEEIQSSFHAFKRNVDIFYYFRGKTNTSNDNYNPKLKSNIKSTWNPPIHHYWNNDIKASIHDMQVAVLQLTPNEKFKKSTIEVTLKDLKDRGDIKITATDKNLGLIALKTEVYHDLILVHLQDEKTYNPICNMNSQDYKELLNTFTHNINELNLRIKQLNQNGQFLTNQEFKYLSEINHSLPPFHVLPKIHKSGPLTSRPIVGATAWITTNYSKILDILLLPYLKEYEYIKNTRDLIEKIEPIALSKDKNYILFTMDITSLYTNINLELLQELIQKVTKNIVITSILEFILTHNFFHYNGTVFKQTRGIPMGTNAAVNLANLYLCELLDVHFQARKEIIYTGRYIDDIFGIWEGSLESLLVFHKLINTLVPDLKLSIEHSTSQISFLDVNIQMITSNDIVKFLFSPFSKSMAIFQYIPPMSSHPHSVFKGFIIGELKRLATNSTLPLHYFLAATLFKTRLLARGFNNRFLNKESLTVYWYERFNKPNLPNAKSIEVKKTIPLVLRFTRRKITPIIKAIQKLKKEESNNLIKFFISYKKSPNIQHLVSSSSLSKNQIQYLKQIKAKKIVQKRSLKRIRVCETSSEEDENQDEKMKK